MSSLVHLTCDQLLALDPRLSRWQWRRWLRDGGCVWIRELVLCGRPLPKGLSWKDTLSVAELWPNEDDSLWAGWVNIPMLSDRAVRIPGRPLEEAKAAADAELARLLSTAIEPVQQLQKTEPPPPPAQVSAPAWTEEEQIPLFARRAS